MAKPKRSRRKPNDRRLREATVLLPLTLNDGSAVPWSQHEAIFDEVFDAFEGWTLEGTVTGAYRMKSGERKVERLLKICVVLDERRVTELENMVRGWAGLLGQEVLLLKVADHQIRLLPPEERHET